MTSVALLKLFLLLVWLSACSAPSVSPGYPARVESMNQHDLTIFAAASLSEVFLEIGERFSAENANINLIFNFAGSQQLVQQLSHGATADVFASADQKQMEVAIQTGRVLEGSQTLFASNRLVVVLFDDGQNRLSQLQDLARPGLRLLLAAEAVPVGRYSLQFLEKASQDYAFGASFKASVLSNVVSYEENVRAVLTKVALGEADAGIVYSSDIAGENAGKVEYLDIPDELNAIAEYPIATIRDSQLPDNAQAFVDFVLSENGQSILAEYGFLPVLKP